MTTRDDFEYWLASMDEFLEEFVVAFSEAGRDRLNFSPESLDIVETKLLATYTDTDSMLRTSEGQRVNRIACYVGETFRKELGGKWDIRFDDPSFVFSGVPILVLPNSTVPHCPLTLVTTAADRRTGNYLRTVLQNS